MAEAYRPIGVIVGRFQVPKLHAGHHFLIESVMREHEDILIVLGTPKSLATERNPLSFEVRAAMLRQEYPFIEIAELADRPSDTEWSDALDDLVLNHPKGPGAVLYGSRDSFLSRYSGLLNTQYLNPSVAENGTALRVGVSKKPLRSEAFRRGVIWAQTNRRGIPYPTVDTAVMNAQRSEVLLGGKSTDGNRLRFIGGFVDPADASLEAAAKREVIEETSSIEVDDFRYIGSTKVDDWRYRGSKDGIMTTFFRATYLFGAPRPADDLVRLQWVPLERLMETLVEEHKPLGEMLLLSLTKESTNV